MDQRRIILYVNPFPLCFRLTGQFDARNLTRTCLAVYYNEQKITMQISKVGDNTISSFIYMDCISTQEYIVHDTSAFEHPDTPISIMQSRRKL